MSRAEETINICEHGIVTSDGIRCPRCDNGMPMDDDKTGGQIWEAARRIAHLRLHGRDAEMNRELQAIGKLLMERLAATADAPPDVEYSPGANWKRLLPDAPLEPTEEMVDAGMDAMGMLGQHPYGGLRARFVRGFKAALAAAQPDTVTQEEG